MSVLEAVSGFQLDLIPSTWVNEVWNSGFNNEFTLPAEYELHLDHTEFSNLILHLINEIKKMSGPRSSGSGVQSTDSSSNNWNELIQKNVNYKALLCLLSTFIKDVDEETISNGDIIMTLKAVRLYINLLSIPGAWQCHIFNSVLFDRALSILKLGNLISSSGSQGQSNQNPGERASASSERQFSEEEKRDMMLVFWLLLHDLTICFKHLKMRDEPDSLKCVIQMVVNLTRYEKRINVFEIPAPQLDNVSKVAFKSYSILELLCSEDHGSTCDTARYILKCIFPSLVITDETLRMPASEHEALKEHTFSFIKRLVSVYKNTISLPVYILTQHIFLKIPDKADIRAKAIPQVIQLMHIHNYSLFKDLLVMFCRATMTDYVKHRIAAVELICKLLTNYSEGIVLSHDPSFNEITPSEKLRFKKFMISLICTKSGEVSPGIRHKSLSVLADLILSNNAEIKEIIRPLFDPSVDRNDNKQFFDFESYYKRQSPDKFIFPDDPLPSGKYFVEEFVDNLVYDRKVFVRKCALLVINNLFAFDERWITKDRIELLVIRCMDKSVMIRKLVSKHLTELVLKYPSNDKIIRAWVLGVVQIVNDIEAKSRENAVEYMRRVFLDNITFYHESREAIQKLPWKVLKLIANEDKQGCLRSAIHSWESKQAIPETVYDAIKSHIGTENNYIVWFLIVTMSEILNFPNPEFIYHYFCDNTDLSTNGNDFISLAVIHSLEFNRSELDTAIQETMNSNLKVSIENFSVRVPFIGPFLDSCYHYNSDETKIWCGTLVQKCESYLQEFIAPGCTAEINEELLSRYIITLGDAANFHPGVSPNIISYLANIIDPTFKDRESGNVPKWNGRVSGDVKAVAVITLGKLCVQSQVITKKYAIIFAKTLSDRDPLSSFLAAKNNSMAALADLYVRYPSVTGRYLSRMYVSLKDRETEVKRNSLKHILDLVKEDTLKLRDPLFFYLLTMLLDQSKKIKDLTNEFFEENILQKNKSIMCHSFVQAVFFFNGSFEKYDMTREEKIVFSLAGDINFAGRAILYKYMLNHMPDDDKFIVLNRLCLDVLEEVSENNIPLDLKGSAVLRDALSCLGYEEMRLQIARGLGEEDPAAKEPEDAEAFKTLSDKLLITHLVKRNYVEQVIPVIIKLRKKLLGLRSPLSPYLMACLKEMMKPYKAEIKEMFAADAQLATELEYDLRQFRMDRTLQDEFEELGLEGYEDGAQSFQLFQSLLLNTHEGLME